VGAEGNAALDPSARRRHLETAGNTVGELKIAGARRRKAAGATCGYYRSGPFMFSGPMDQLAVAPENINRLTDGL
jgi:hypothetical protein